jgi:hypothetical protein
MRCVPLIAFALMLALPARAAEWRVERIDVPARVTGMSVVDGQVRAYIGGLWYLVARNDGKVAVAFRDDMPWPKAPGGALPDSRLATGTHDIARAWLAEPTDAYDHGVLGDKIEARAVLIETRGGERQTVRLGKDAVFEDLEPRIADLDGDGRDEVVVVKSYLKRGSALALIGERKGRYAVLAETPPLGAPHRWLDPAGIGNFTGGDQPGVALVRQPHTVGTLELWTWHAGRLQKTAEMEGFTNHIIGTRAIDMAAVADFDGDGVADLALPAFDRASVRIVSFAPQPREIAHIKLPAKAVTDLGLLPGEPAPAVTLGLEDGSLVVIERRP